MLGGCKTCWGDARMKLGGAQVGTVLVGTVLEAAMLTFSIINSLRS